MKCLIAAGINSSPLICGKWELILGVEDDFSQTCSPERRYSSSNSLMLQVGESYTARNEVCGSGLEEVKQPPIMTDRVAGTASRCRRGSSEMCLDESRLSSG